MSIPSHITYITINPSVPSLFCVCGSQIWRLRHFAEESVFDAIALNVGCDTCGRIQCIVGNKGSWTVARYALRKVQEPYCLRVHGIDIAGTIYALERRKPLQGEYGRMLDQQYNESEKQKLLEKLKSCIPCVYRDANGGYTCEPTSVDSLQQEQISTADFSLEVFELLY